jgi:hypothetical protein
MNPVIIIGAPRSGTNILRDLISQFEDHATWPCDEINYIWRHGNRSYPSDEFTSAMATASVAKYIRGQFVAEQTRAGVSNIIEKTCANSLRVGFVDKIFPDAKYLYLVRDGVDVVGSAQQRWKASLDVSYILAKARYVPPADFFYYGSRYFKSRIHKVFSKSQRLGIWGPQLDDMDRLLERHTLDEVCALQWQKCVENSERDLSRIEAGRVHKLHYENLVSNPHAELTAIAGFLGANESAESISSIVQAVSPSSVGKGRAALGTEVSARLEALVSGTLHTQGYLT